MSISLISKPVTWARVYDTNRMTYQFSSTNYTQPNFQFQFVLAYWDAAGTYHNIGTFNLFPLSGGTVEFNPSVVYKNYIAYDYNASNTSLTECLNATGKFVLIVYEYYGTPPTTHINWTWQGESSLATALKVYNGCQQNIPYDYVPLNIDSNYKWVMSSGTTKGQFLTDATEYRLSNTDLAFLYFNGGTDGRPTRIKYTLYYNCYGSGDPTEDTLGLGYDMWNQQLGGQSPPQRTPNIDLDLISGVTYGGSWTGICNTVFYDTNISYSYPNYALQYYFPMGPYQLIGSGLMTSYYQDKWIYYTVDLLSGSTLLNKQPFVVWNTCKSNRFGKWQLAWLNPHGGFDCYTFDRKNEINYKLDKSTYKQKLPPNPGFSTYDAGERVFNSTVTQEITLRSNLLTQKEAQLLVQMAQSPRVYVNTIYTYAGSEYPYGVPYIIVNESIKYEQKKNDKEIVMEIKIRPANDAVIQND